MPLEDDYGIELSRPAPREVGNPVRFTAQQFAAELSELFPISEEDGLKFLKALSGTITGALWRGELVDFWKFGILRTTIMEETYRCEANSTLPKPRRMVARLVVDRVYRRTVVMGAIPAPVMARGRFQYIERNVATYPRSDDWQDRLPEGRTRETSPDDGSGLNRLIIDKRANWATNRRGPVSKKDLPKKLPKIKEESKGDGKE